MRVSTWLRRPGRRAAGTSLDLADPRVSLDPFPHYEELRASGDVHFLAHHDWWVVIGYDTVRAALRAPDEFRSTPYEPIDRVLLGAGPPRHTAARKLVGEHFAPATVERVARRAHLASVSLLDSELDVVAGYSVPLSRAVAAELIGFDAQTVGEIVAAGESARSHPDPVAALIEALDAVAPRSALYRTLREAGADEFEDQELRSLVRLLWLAATTTTERVITRCVLRLLQHEAVLAAVLADRALIARLVEEVMRLHPPEHMLPRAVTRPVMVGGTTIPEGASVQLCIAAANRDPAQFQAPTELRLDRPPKAHFAFGAGIHHCLGAALTRRVVTGAVGQLLDGRQGLRALQPLSDIPYFHTPTALSPSSLLIAR